MSANFTPTKPTFKQLVYLNMQTLTNFPYIEDDFDALTNYGLLCKVVEYLNNVISNNNQQNQTILDLYDAYIELQDYVNNYFDNLDVQEEIDKKLDEMAEDGTLSQYLNSIVETKVDSDIMPIVQLQNEKINTMEDKVDAATSGTPRGAYASVEALTTADPDHDYIYVVISDGKWYYYDTTNSQWTAGGTYQTSASDDFILTLEGAYDDCIIAHETVNIFHTTQANIVEDRLLSLSTGEISPSVYTGYYTFDNYIDIIDSNTYYFSLYNLTSGAFSTLIGCTLCFYDEDKTFISGVAVTGGGTGNQPISAPSGAKYIRLSLAASYYNGYKFMVSANSYPQTYSDYFETYYTINPDAITNELPQTIVYNDIVVDANGDGDYTTLQGAFSYITTQNDNTYYNRYNVYVKDGNYNMAANFQPGDYDNSSFSGIFIPDYTYIKGVGNKENIVIYCTCETKQQYISTLNLSGTCGIENVTINGTKTRYVIHADTTQSLPYEHTIKNCIIKGVETYYSVVYGSGTFDNANWLFEDVIFDGTQTGGNQSSGIAFTVHNSLNAQGNRFIKFINCRFLTTANYQACYFKSLNYRVSDPTESANDMLTYVSVYGCQFGNHGFKLMEENASVYGGGCQYFVTGYGNKNDQYEIINTDEHDYSNRVNLI